MPATTIDLQPFCDTTSARFALGEPFVQGGWICATDGRIAVRVPDDSPDSPLPEGKRRPEVSEVFKSWSDDWKFEPWPAAEYVKRSMTCRKCDGTGADKHHECPDCEGDGMVDCVHCGHEYECDRCDGDGVVKCGKCSLCKGTKEAVQESHVVVGGAAVAYGYDQKIRTLGTVTYHVHDNYVFFRFDGGGQGIAAPIRMD